MFDKKVGIPLSKLNKFEKTVIYFNRWAWVDPARDLQATQMELELGLDSKIRVCAERGLDFEELCRERAEVERLEQQYGVKVNVNKPTPTPEVEKE
jgi:capsid protein